MFCCAFLPCFENNTEDTEHRCSNCDHLIGTACSDDILAGWFWEKNKSLYFLCSGNTFTNNNFLVSWCLSVFSFLFFETFFKIPFGNYTSQKNCILNKIHMLHYFQNLFFLELSSYLIIICKITALGSTKNECAKIWSVSSPDSSWRHPKGFVLFLVNCAVNLSTHQHQIGSGMNCIWN